MHAYVLFAIRMRYAMRARIKFHKISFYIPLDGFCVLLSSLDLPLHAPQSLRRMKKPTNTKNRDCSLFINEGYPIAYIIREACARKARPRLSSNDQSARLRSNNTVSKFMASRSVDSAS